MRTQVRYKGIDSNQDEVWASATSQSGSPTVALSLQTDGNLVVYVNGGAAWAASWNHLNLNTVGSPPHRFWIMNNGDLQIHRYDSSTGSWSTKWKVSDYYASVFAKSGYPTTLEEDGELCHPNYDKPSGSGSNCLPQWCVSCPMGLIAVNMSACVPCPQGTYLGNGSTACTQCAAGKYGKAVTGQDAADDCANCDAGKFSSTAGSTVCTACGAGTYALAAASMCTECAAGKYGKAVMSATDVTGQDEADDCTNCPRGTHSGVTGASSSTSCLLCPNNSFTPFEASTSLTNCTCNFGYTGTPDMSCSACPPGTFKDVNGTAKCAECVAGKYSEEWADIGDSPGQYSYQQAEYQNCIQTEGPLSDCLLILRPPGCTPCHENAWAPTGSGNRSMCLCNAGYTGPDGGNCQSCLAGTFKPTNGSQACLLCETGKFSTLTAVTAASSCFQCPSNASSDAGSGNISDCKCNAGWFGEDGGPCATCEPGTFKAISGASECKSCDVGKYSNSSGASECAGCDEGKYSQSRAATTCTTCPQGSISGENSTRAEDCLCNNVLRYFGPPGGTCVHECSQEAVRAAFFEEHADRVEILRAEVSLEFTCKRVRLRACVSACVPLRICVREQNPYDMYTATRV